MAYLYRGCCYLPSLTRINQIIFCYTWYQCHPLYTIQLYLQYIILYRPFKPNYIWLYPLKSLAKYPVWTGLTKHYIVLFESIDSIYGYILAYPNYIWQVTHTHLYPVLLFLSFPYYISIHLISFLYLLLYRIRIYSTLHLFLYSSPSSSFNPFSYIISNLLSAFIS